MSLNLRIILSATAVLVIFITLTAPALNRAFIESTESALRDKLTSQLYVLLAAAEVDNDEITMPSSELDALLGLPSSGVYAFITDETGKIMWQSSSAIGTNLPPPITQASGKKYFSKIHANLQEFYNLSYGINWVTESRSLALTFSITTELDSFNKQIEEYQNTLWGWLLAMAILLLISQAAILRWGLTPLRKVGSELHNIESGKQQQIEQKYPQEIEHLTNNINHLLQQERDQKTRYRNALGDLAHSLKTPLAVLQSSIESASHKQNFDKDSGENKTTMQEQISRMNGIVEYQLQRAATAGASTSAQALSVESMLDRMLKSLEKVYKEKHVNLNISVKPETTFKGDEGDLMELLGNLLDNAFKWTNSRIDVSAERKNKKLHLTIMDDGPGISPDQIESLLQRGTRADQNVSGHGIGLSIVSNIIEAYQGELTIEKSPFGGAKFIITI